MTQPDASQLVRLLGKSDVIRRIEADADCASRSDAKVLITGETGVGKEIVARLIHQRSARAAAPLVTLNCAGLPDSLLESELFGHVRGSFTGAYRDKPGLLEMAPQGTVFLDEVGEMSPRMQAVLLRFVESGEIQRVGSDRTHARVNVRLITATNRDLQVQIENGAFREDLYFRLNVLRVVIPPLRARTEDIPILLEFYLRRYSEQHRVAAPELTADAIGALVAYRWPGNVRELTNVVERIVLHSAGMRVDSSELPPEIIKSQQPAQEAAAAAAAAHQPSQAEELASLMLDHGQSFWSVVHPTFMSRDLTRNDLRKIVQIGLERTNGRYRQLVGRFNMPVEDYKRFMSFLRKHDCHLPFQRFRTAAAQIDDTPSVGPLSKAKA